MPKTIGQAINRNFLGNSPDWYKWTLIAFLIANPILLHTVGPFVTGWVLIAEFIFTLALALKCYPLPAGGLLAIEAVALGMTSPQVVYEEAVTNFPVILLLIFMVAGIYFMKDLLQYTFTKILVGIRSKVFLGLLFSFTGAFLSAFLDALTVTAVIIAVAYGFYDVYHRFASGKRHDEVHDCRMDDGVQDCYREDLSQFRAFLRNLMMHGAVGTALGGVCTLVGEPQNLLIGSELGWHFMDFFYKVVPVSMPVLVVGLLTCMALEKFKLFGYGYTLPESVREKLIAQSREDDAKRTIRGKASLIAQGIVAVILVVSLALHVAEVGIIGLMVIVLLTAMTGVTDEHRIGKAFEEALPFTALLVVFFAIVAVIHSQHLFSPVTEYVLSLQGQTQLAAYYIANGVLSMISDNVFVATVYVTETKMHFTNVLEQIMARAPELKMTAEELMDQLTDTHGHPSEVIATLPDSIRESVRQMMDQFHLLAVSINTGTNIPSVATPNGQAAFLFLLTSALAPIIRLSYGQMVKLALPYTVTMSITGLAATWFFL